MNDVISIGGYLLWGLAGLVLGTDPNPQGAATSRPKPVRGVACW